MLLKPRALEDCMRESNRQTLRRALRVALPATLLLLIGLPAPRAEAAPGDKLKGKWQAVAMEIGGKRHPVKAPMSIVFHYKSGGQFEVTISSGKRTVKQQGTWSATATVLTMEIKGKTESANYRVSGSKLTMNKEIAGQKAKYHMKRIP
jgi:hypothetical protein